MWSGVLLLLAAVAAHPLQEYGSEEMPGGLVLLYRMMLRGLVGAENHDGGEQKASLQAVKGWPADQLKLGQIGGVAVCPHGNVHVFHRVERIWSFRSFDMNNNFRQVSQGPIANDVLVSLTPDKGQVAKTAGKKIEGCNVSGDDFCGFYLPHGLTIDGAGNRWMTDVALHQVIRFPPSDDKPDLVLGRKLIPGNDDNTFCKPTDVAVMDDGTFFVADGYCNSRVIKFSANGTRVGVVGEGRFNVPHSLSLRQDLDLLCVADRENGRILCFRVSSEEEVASFSAPEFGGRVFAIEFHPTERVLYAVNGPNVRGLPVSGFTISLDNGRVVDSWAPGQTFSAPHDVTVSQDGSVYVGEIGPNKIWKFQ